MIIYDYTFQLYKICPRNNLIEVYEQFYLPLHFCRIMDTFLIANCYTPLRRP